MNNDGIGFMGAGTSDNRIAGKDLQHNRQPRTADEQPQTKRAITEPSESGGPMKQAIDSEADRHKESLGMRLKHLEDHYKR